MLRSALRVRWRAVVSIPPMRNARPTPTSPTAAEPEQPVVFDSASIPEATRDAPDTGFVALSHEAIFASAPAPERCDACGRALPVPEEDDGGYAVRGQGVYRWVRGDEARFEKAPLCPSCAAAIGMTALARWEIEEEEG